MNKTKTLASIFMLPAAVCLLLGALQARNIVYYGLGNVTLWMSDKEAAYAHDMEDLYRDFSTGEGERIKLEKPKQQGGKHS